MSFGATTRQMLNLWSTAYGIGIQNFRLYFRTASPGGGFAWFGGGSFTNATDNPGPGGAELMLLDGSGNLSVSGNVTANAVLPSDRAVKENFQAMDPRGLLDKVAALPISEWNYKRSKGERHVGPMAQDFYSAFGLGADDKHIAVVDEGGVALAAIQGLNQKVDEQLKAKDAEIAQLKQRLAQLEELVSRLAARQETGE
jgi:hypothetical protein